MREQLNFLTMSCVWTRVVTVVIVSCVIRVTAESDELFEFLPYTDDQLKDLAGEVCMSLFPLAAEEAKDKNCQRNFLRPREFSAAPSKLDVICRTKDAVTFAITPSDHWQVVALIPKDPYETITISLMKAFQSTSSVDIRTTENAAFWTAALNDDGTPGTWLRGPDLPKLENREYAVDVQGPYFKYNGGLQIEAVFRFVFTEGIDHCIDIDISNSCGKRTLGGFSKHTISFESLHREVTHKNRKKLVAKWSDPNIPIDDVCQLKVWRGTQMLTVKKYNSSVIPNQIERQLPKQKFKMHVASLREREDHTKMGAVNLSQELEATDVGWNIIVKWTAPEVKVEKYNITLKTTQVTRTSQVPGNATEFKFTSVPGKDIPFYNVTLLGFSSNGDISTNVSQWGRFPAPEPVRNVTLRAKDSGVGWDIHVKWDRPSLTPSKYGLFLVTPKFLQNISVSGRATEFTFKNVWGEENTIYNVTIFTITPYGFASTNPIRALFPVRISYKTVIMTGSWSIVLTLAAAIIGIYVWWRRRQDGYSYFPGLAKQLRDIEACSEPCVEDSWEVCSERLKLKEVIGEGAFGVVRKGILEPGHRDVAVKMLKDFPTLEEIRSFRAEMELMKSVGAHPHIVSLVGCCSGRRPRIVAEYCSRGDLLHLLRYSWDLIVLKRNAKYYNNNTEGSDYRNDLFKTQNDHSKLAPLVVNKLYDLPEELTPSDLLSFCRQIAMGMEFLASNRVVHRDLAARNILVTSDRTLKIADFGLSRDIYQENQYKQKGNGKLPIKWMALESLTNRIYTTQSDVWSFGVVVWEVVTVGGAPYPDVPAARLPRLLRAGYRMPRPNNCSDQLYEVMVSCWRARARERPTFAELHRALDELLNSACADQYLSLELDHEAPPTPKPARYLDKLFKGNRVWTRGENYEWPLKKLQSNYYTSAPASIAKPQAV